MASFSSISSQSLPRTRRFILQRYEKSSAEASASLIMPRRSIYDEVKDTNKREQCQIYLNIAERECLRRSQRYGKSSAKASVSLIMPRRSIKTQSKIRISEGKSKLVCILPGGSIQGASRIWRISRESTHEARAEYAFFRPNNWFLNKFSVPLRHALA